MYVQICQLTGNDLIPVSHSVKCIRGVVDFDINFDIRLSPCFIKNLTSFFCLVSSLCVYMYYLFLYAVEVVQHVKENFLRLHLIVN